MRRERNLRNLTEMRLPEFAFQFGLGQSPEQFLMHAANKHTGRDSAAAVTGNQAVQMTESVKSPADMSAVIENVASKMAHSGFARRDIVGVRVALEEAVLNSFKHAYHNSPGKPVIIRHVIDRDQVLLEVEDQGTGFNPASIPDPTSPENWERDSGRGIFLMRSYMNSVSFNDRGNCVTLCKQPSELTAADGS
ncbi:MAG: btrW [Planctomycetaceae bacterium]|nr:btrW [Planctomycetaceae bacterium]